MRIRSQPRERSGLRDRLVRMLHVVALYFLVTMPTAMAQSYPGGEEPPPDVGGVVQGDTAFPRGDGGPLPVTGLELTLFALALAAVAAAFVVRRRLRARAALTSDGV